MKETWLPIPGYEGKYCVSDQGNVMSMSYMGTGLPGILKFNDSRGYKTVELQTGAIKKRFTVHRLVMLAFVGERPKGMQINHINGIKSYNWRSNLEYCTPSENQKHSFKLGLQSNVGERHSRAKLKEQDVIEMRKLHREGKSKILIAAKFNISQSHLSHIISGRLWSHLTVCEKVG